MALVSIIIPIYNSEKYLNECLDSLAKQTLKDIEILCLVSESTDNSRDIVKEYVQKDSRFVLIERSYEFAGASRNAGIDAAKGKYLFFVDSDDKLNEFACEYAYHVLETNQADIAYFNADYMEEERFLGKVCDFSKVLKNKKDCIIYPQKDDTDIFILPNFIWAKCFRKELLIENNIKFDNFKFAEDVCFQIRSYLSAKKIIIKDFSIYYYRINDSNSTSKFNHNYKDLIKAYENMYKFIKATPYPNLLNSFCICIVHTLIHFYNNGNLTEENRKTYFELMRNLFIKIEIENNIVWKKYQKELSDVIAHKYDIDYNNKAKLKIVEKIFFFGIPLVYIKQKWHDKYYYLFNSFKFMKKWSTK